MKALLLTGPSRFSHEEWPDPVPGPGEVLIRVRACGICGSDIHGMTGSTGRRIPPIVMGHEASGDIEELGEGVSGWSTGDRVTFDSTVFCGTCERCRKGEVNLCPNRQVLGVSCEDYRRHGCFAEKVAVPSHILHRVPVGVAHEEAAFVEPLAVALHAAGRVPPGKSAAVVGSGLIGLLLIQVLKAKGWSRIIAVDTNAGRLQLAKSLGATDIVSAGPQAGAEIQSLTSGTGVDAAFEVVGIGPALGTAVEAVTRGGHICLVGNFQPQVPLPLQKIVTGEITLTGSCASAGEYPEALQLLASGDVQTKPLTTAVVPLEEAEVWFHRLHDEGGDLLKVIVQP